ncbi:HNH endonuclease [Geothrix terrae]|uniref:HNH endonuclease n=1 Tax=Geothrix terrae TaxID=2922720 RepID=UPI001FAE324F|nr:HNH endonuclease [Geothrix terrae]
MTITLKTHKMLWGRSANRCAICRRELVMDASETDDESIVGEACHVVAQNADGPRGDSDLPLDQRDKYSNLILLCNVHHKQIDDQINLFTIDRLTTIKSDHEVWVRTQLDYDPKKQRDDEIYADYVELWSEKANLKIWKEWTSWLLGSGQPSLNSEVKMDLEELTGWLLSRVWPQRNIRLEESFSNFRLVLQDLMLVFNEHAELRGGHLWQTSKFYREVRDDRELYDELSKEFDFHVDLVQDLTLELTRAVNYVCDMVREYLMPSYRIKEGVALTMGGPYMDMTYKTYRVEYRGAERIARPYPGLDKFIQVRFSRDRYFGTPDSIDA